MTDIANKTTWAKTEGLLPIRLDPTVEGERYIMLNGGLQDFCLDITHEEISAEDSYSAAWSTNSKNYISIQKDSVHIFNWVLNNHSKLPLKVVQDRFDQFLSIIKQNTYRTDEDITPFVINFFRQMRNLTCETHEPIEALGLLYKLLISLKHDVNTIDCDKWDINDVSIPYQFDEIVDNFKSGVRGITPNLDYILRHCSGPIFQEAHREVAFFNPQRDLFGGISSNLSFKSSRDAYSSIHYTPQYIARSIVENVLSNIDLTKPMLKILDPACGSGAFLVEVLKQLNEYNYSGDVIVNGWDISQSAVNTTRFLLKYEQTKVWNQRLKYVVLRVEDSLQHKWDSDYDIILMNPPFLSWELLKNDGQKDAVESSLRGVVLKRRPNQAAAFFYKACGSLSNNGVIGTVLPSSILLFDQYVDLRNRIMRNISICSVARLGNFIFEDALTDVSFFIGVNSKIADPTKTIWCSNERGAAYLALKNWRKSRFSNSAYVSGTNYSIYTPVIFPIIKNTWNVMPMKEEQFLSKLMAWVKMGKLSTVGHIFSISQGLLSGRRNIFDITQMEYDALPDKEQLYYRPLIHSGSISKGCITTTKYIWFPYDSNGLLINSEEELKLLDFSWNRLIRYKSELEERKSVKNWWELTRPRTWQFNPQFRLYSQRFGNHNSFGIGLRDDYVIAEGNAFTLSISKYVKDDYYFYLALFSSGTFERMLSIFSKRIMAGYDLGKIQIMDIPIVDVSINDVRLTSQYKQMVNIGKRLSTGDAFMSDLVDDILSYFYPLL